MTRTNAIGLFAAFACIGTASAAIIDPSVEVLELMPGTITFRIYANFDNPADRLLSVAADEDVASFHFYSDRELIQDTTVPGSGLHDVPGHSAITGPADSWVTIGGDWANGMTDTEFSPGFLGDGFDDRIAGSELFFEHNGGYFDFDPGTPENGGSVLIAQFTLPDDVSVLKFSGTFFYVSEDSPDLLDRVAFIVVVPAAPSLALLVLGGLGVGRRRR
ncbi:MAG: hypothetical protein AB8G96_07910 [Phycisphaerales bacterium]